MIGYNKTQSFTKLGIKKREHEDKVADIKNRYRRNILNKTPSVKLNWPNTLWRALMFVVNTNGITREDVKKHMETKWDWTIYSVMDLMGTKDAAQLMDGMELDERVQLVAHGRVKSADALAGMDFS